MVVINIWNEWGLMVKLAQIKDKGIRSVEVVVEELVTPEVEERRFNGTFKASDDIPLGVMQNTIKKQLGHGHYSRVKPHPSDPHLVKKTSHNIKYSGDDGYRSFIAYIIENKLTDNIHFPKVYNIRTITDKNGKKIYSFDVERLVPLRKLGVEQMKAALDSHFNDDRIEEVEDEDDGIGIIMTNIDMAVHEGVFSVLKTQELKDACFILFKLSKDEASPHWFDLKYDNMMWRLTPYGAQLVFTDPLA